LSCYNLTDISDISAFPPIPLQGEDGIQVAFEELAGVGEVFSALATAVAIPAKVSSRMATMRFCSGERGQCKVEIEHRVDIGARHSRTS